MKIVIIKIITSVMISKLILSHRHDNTDHALRDRSRVIVSSRKGFTTPFRFYWTLIFVAKNQPEGHCVIVSLVMVTTRYYYVIK